MQDVAGKVAFITGAASGMGLGMARAFSAAGMKVMLADIEQTVVLSRDGVPVPGTAARTSADLPIPRAPQSSALLAGSP